MKFLNAKIGDTFEVLTKPGQKTSITSSGIVYDPALAPASTEQAEYFYISAKTFASFENPVLDEVRILIAKDPLNLEAPKSSNPFCRRVWSPYSHVQQFLSIQDPKLSR